MYQNIIKAILIHALLKKTNSYIFIIKLNFFNFIESSYMNFSTNYRTN